MVLPKREIHTIEELFEVFPEVKEIFIDATERPIQRPKNKEKQKQNYSGKKKRHTKKNMVIATKTKRIIYFSSTVEGKKHDCAEFKDEFSWQPPVGHSQIMRNYHVCTDLGFLGIEKTYPWLNIQMPKKKPKGKELTEEEKQKNKEINSIRVKVEHAIGGIKRFGVISDIFRNKQDEFNDKVMEVSCGLWNYHLNFTK